MKYSTINVLAESKNKFLLLKKKYAIKTDDDTLNRICDYFIVNDISVRDFGSLKADRTIADELKKHIDKRHDWVKNNDQSLRGFIGKFSNEYWQDTLKNVLEIKAILIDKNFDITDNNYQNDKPINLEIEEKKETIKQDFSTDAIEQLEEDYRKLLEKFKTVNAKLERIKNNTEIESVGMFDKKKIVVNLSLEDWQNMFI